MIQLDSSSSSNSRSMTKPATSLSFFTDNLRTDLRGKMPRNDLSLTTAPPCLRTIFGLPPKPVRVNVALIPGPLTEVTGLMMSLADSMPTLLGLNEMRTSSVDPAGMLIS